MFASLPLVIEEGPNCTEEYYRVKHGLEAARAHFTASNIIKAYLSDESLIPSRRPIQERHLSLQEVGRPPFILFSGVNK